MQYILLIYSDENCWTEEESEACYKKSRAISEALTAQGKLISSAPLHPITSATSLRVRNGKQQITDGPFAETTEQLGGYYIVDVDNLDQALEIAASLPPAKKGTVEVRPIMQLNELN